ncbi:lactadherin isoform 2-T2 [Discoglossus pictus]
MQAALCPLLITFLGGWGIFAAGGDVCDENTCLNGGTCLSNVNNSPVYCLCPDGFTGINCNETEKGPCFPNPCYNSGECQVLSSSRRGDTFAEYVCKCPPGFNGIHCQNNKSDCSRNPCQNGGVCQDLSNDYTCKCASPFIGKTCKFRCSNALGMEGRAISDAQITSSSLYHAFLGLQRWGPNLARLNNKGIVNAWTANHYDKRPWIQVNLLRPMRVSVIMTQGASRVGTAEYVRTYKVSYSVDGQDFVYYKDEGRDVDKVFTGNVDNNGIKANMFSPPITAQYIRVYPVVCQRACTLRFELIGCETNGCSEPLGMRTSQISDVQITASSVFKTWGIDAFTWYPHFARLDKIGKTNAWTSLDNNQSEWLQIDLLNAKKISGIITQGAKDFGNIQYVEAFKVAYSDNGSTWIIYKDYRTNTDKVFLGNNDNYSHKRNIFNPPFTARFVRILPKSWHGRITLRMELLGCDN